ncbi:hypothetical protein Tco_0057346, partial [Tanacetum coccineum]
DEDTLEDSSKQGRKIFDIDEDPNISLVQDEGITWFQDVDAEKNSVDTEIILEEEQTVENLAYISEGVLKRKKNRRIAKDAEIARQLHEEINKAGQERVVAKYDQAH